MTAKHREIEARTWLSDFGVRCAATIKSEESELRARDYAKGFTDLAPECFCDASREAAARQFEYFPSYATLRKFLEGWWRDNKPRPPELPGADDGTLDLDDRLWLRRWTNDRVAEFQHLRDKGSPTERMAISLSNMRVHAPRCFRYLARTDTDVASIAVHRGWDVELQHQGERTPEEIAWAHNIVAMATSGMRTARSPAAASGAVVSIDQARQDAAAAHARMVAALPPEQLAAARDANAGVQKARAHQQAAKDAELWTPNWED